MCPLHDGSEERDVPPSDKAATIPNPRPSGRAHHAYASTVASSGEGRVDDVDAELAQEQGFAARYDRRAQLGEGGMGEVWLCKDARIGRHVAMKVIRPGHGSRSDLRRRFLREVRVQGQLEHPSIVPVYDLGRDPTGAAFFTMKRLKGLTVEQIVERLRAGDEEVAREHTRFKLLAAFASICQAVHFAHTHGVVHRDLKPGNVMLGDFGEVHVLDWGLAKVTGAPELEAQEGGEGGAVEVRETTAAATEVGAVMGTPGYMAPEQVRGDEKIGPAADIYALGAILYELLALSTLHPPGDAQFVLAATLAGADTAAASTRAQRDVPPELEAICVRATALEPADRYESARALQRDVERFLEGDRDLERRRELAREHAQAAADAAKRALSGERPIEERGRAMREVSRAVALDPQNTEAMGTLVRLLTELPRDLPEEARAESDAAARRWQRTGARTAGYAYLSWAAYGPFCLWMGIRDWTTALVLVALWLVAAILSFRQAKHPHPQGRASWLVLIASNLAIACSASMMGPFVIAPALGAVNALAYVVGSDRAQRIPAVALGCASFLAPLACERLGLEPPSFVFKEGTIVLLPRLMSFPPGPTLLFLVVTHVALLATAAFFVARFKDVLSETEGRLYMHTWHLRQFVPGDARGALASTPGESLDFCAVEDRVRRHGIHRMRR